LTFMTISNIVAHFIFKRDFFIKNFYKKYIKLTNEPFQNSNL
jgi:hypothetical protein